MEQYKEITVLAPAKINIYLGVTGKRPDGYHDIDSVMQTVGIFDKVKVSAAKAPEGQSISVICPGNAELSGEKNIAHRMALAFLRYAKIEKYDIKIEIEKVIPMEAGLGGGSSDAAAVVCALNELLETEFTEDELMSIGATVGADVPFLVGKGTAFVGGIGEIITPCREIPQSTVLVAYPHNEKVSTGKAYGAIDAGGAFSSTEEFQLMRLAVTQGDMSGIASASYNIFETVIPEDSIIIRIKKMMTENGALFSLMSGSGSAVFGFFPDECSARAAESVIRPVAKTFVTELCRKTDSYTVK